jgi:putative flippase GtrA
MAVMGFIDYSVTTALIGWNMFWAKFLASILGFAGNFLLRRCLIFPEKGSLK